MCVYESIEALKSEMIRSIQRLRFPASVYENSAEYAPADIARQEAEWDRLYNEIRFWSLERLDCYSYRTSEPPEDPRNTIKPLTARDWLQMHEISLEDGLHLVFGIDPGVSFASFPVEVEEEYGRARLYVLDAMSSGSGFEQDNTCRKGDGVSCIDQLLEILFEREGVIAETTHQAWIDLKQSKLRNKRNNPYTLDDASTEIEPQTNLESVEVANSREGSDRRVSDDYLTSGERKKFKTLQKIVLGLAMRSFEAGTTKEKPWDPTSERNTANSFIASCVGAIGLDISSKTVQKALDAAYAELKSDMDG